MPQDNRTHPVVYSPSCGTRGVYFPGTRGNYMLVSQHNSGIDGSVKSRLDKKPSSEGKEKETLLDAERFLTLSANVAAMLKYLVLKI